MDKTPHMRKKFTAASLRHALVSAFLDACSTSCKPSNIKSGFAKSGMRPLRPDVALNHHDLPLIPDPAVVRSPSKINSTILTDDETIEELAHHLLGRPINEAIDHSIQTIIDHLKASSMQDGIGLSPLPKLVTADDGVLSRFALE